MKNSSLQNFLGNYPHISLANKDDNDEILDFYHQTSLSSSKSRIIYERFDNFFSFLKERSTDYLVLLLRDDKNMIQGMGVISYRQGYINGELQTVGYLGDLRVKMNRKLIREWRLMYANLMKLSPIMKETFNCHFYQTVLIDENLESIKNLAETKIANLHYNPLIRYKMVNVLGRIKIRKNHFFIRWAKLEDKKDIVDFLTMNTSHDFFSHDWNLELEHRLNTWNNFDLSHVLLALEDQKIIAISMVWNPIKTKQIKVDKIPASLKAFHFFAKHLPFVEMKELPMDRSPIKILYLNQITFLNSIHKDERTIAANDFLHFCFQKNFHMLAYADFENENYLQNSWHLVTQKMSMGLYSVHYKNDDNEILDPLSWNPSNPTPTFDMSLV